MNPFADRHAARHRRRRLIVAIALAMLIGLSCTSTAAARGLNKRSDRAALGAYNRYLGSLLSRSTIGARRDDGFLNHVRSGCLGYLAPFASQISTSAGHAFGVEIGADIAIRFTSANGKPFRHLTHRLTKLRWSSGAASDSVGTFISAEQELLHLRPSKLCVDAIQLGYRPTHVSRRTAEFDDRFTQVTTAATQALSDFLGVLQRYERRGDRRLVTSINRRAATYQSLTDSIEGPVQTRLIQDLGLQALS